MPLSSAQLAALVEATRARQKAVRPENPVLGKRLTWAGALAAMLLLTAPSAARADSVMLWNDTLLGIIQQTSGLRTDGPPEVAREIAMVDTAMYDAVNAATGETYKPYAYTGGPVVNASADAAALQAGYKVMQSLFTNNPVWGAGGNSLPPSVPTSITDAYNMGLAALGSGTAVKKGLALGTAAGNEMIAARTHDGSAAAIVKGLKKFTPLGSGKIPGVYVPPDNRPAMFPTWGAVKPFTMTSSSQFPVPPAPDITSTGYAASILETECVGAAGGAGSLPGSIRSACASASGGNNFGLPKTAGKLGNASGPTPSNAQLALFWNDPGTTLTPPGHWLSIADTVLTDGGVTNELQQARVGAMIGTAEADAGIAAWETKYLPFPTGTLWRPISAIHDCNDWNDTFTTCDPEWKSVIATPPHPDYLAGHPTFSTAAATALVAFFGTDDIPFCSTSLDYLNDGVTVEPITLCYDSFLAAGQDAGISRIYGGIHTTYAVFDGAVLGAEIADQLIANDFTLRVAEPPAFAVFGMALAGLLHWRALVKLSGCISTRQLFRRPLILRARSALMLSPPARPHRVERICGSSAALLAWPRECIPRQQNSGVADSD
jgi:hypothetical protein